MDRIYTNGWLWLLPAVYLVHLVDERYYWIGTAEFATRYLGILFTNDAWWMVNVPSMVVMGVVAGLTVRRRLPEWVAVSMAVHLLLHGLGRVPTSLWTWEIAPGLLTGLTLCTPVGLATLARARGRMATDAFRRGLLVGVASFQPLWHAILWPFLPEGMV